MTLPKSLSQSTLIINDQLCKDTTVWDQAHQGFRPRHDVLHGFGDDTRYAPGKERIDARGIKLIHHDPSHSNAISRSGRLTGATGKGGIHSLVDSVGCTRKIKLLKGPDRSQYQDGFRARKEGDQFGYGLREVRHYSPLIFLRIDGICVDGYLCKEIVEQP